MSERAFTEKSVQPTEESLKQILGDCNAYYVQLLDVAKAYSTKWGFYKGWSLKVFDKKKALFYLIPYENTFLVGLTLRESELEKLRTNQDIAYMHEQINSSEKISEGFPIQMWIHDENSAAKCNKFIAELIKLR